MTLNRTHCIWWHWIGHIVSDDTESDTLYLIYCFWSDTLYLMMLNRTHCIFYTVSDDTESDTLYLLYCIWSNTLYLMTLNRTHCIWSIVCDLTHCIWYTDHFISALNRTHRVSSDDLSVISGAASITRARPVIKRAWLPQSRWRRWFFPSTAGRPASAPSPPSRRAPWTSPAACWRARSWWGSVRICCCCCCCCSRSDRSSSLGGVSDPRTADPNNAGLAAPRAPYWTRAGDVTARSSPGGS